MCSRDFNPKLRRCHYLVGHSENHHQPKQLSAVDAVMAVRDFKNFNPSGVRGVWARAGGKAADLALLAECSPIFLTKIVTLRRLTQFRRIKPASNSIFTRLLTTSNRKIRQARGDEPKVQARDLHSNGRRQSSYSLGSKCYTVDAVVTSRNWNERPFK